MPSGGIGQWCSYTTDKVWEEKKSLWNYNSIFIKMSFLTSGLILMSYITVMFCFKTLFFLTGENQMVKPVFYQVHYYVSFTLNITASLSST